MEAKYVPFWLILTSYKNTYLVGIGGDGSIFQVKAAGGGVKKNLGKKIGLLKTGWGKNRPLGQNIHHA